MRLYKLNNDDRDRTHVYARDPKHIINLVNYYRKKLTPEQEKDPELHSWVREPSLDKILEVKQGALHFIGSVVAMDGEEELFDVKLKVTPDFTVAMPHESLHAFGIWRVDLPLQKREELYKGHVPHALFGGQYFLPEDIVRAIVGYDLKPHIDKAKAKLRKIQSIRHENIRLLHNEINL